MNKYLLHVDTWLACNRLSLNVDKTVYMTLGNYSDSVLAHTCIKIRDKPLLESKAVNT